MKLFSKLVFFLFSNLVALLAAAYFIEGFEISPGFINYLTVAAILTLINVLIWPILKHIIFGPIIIAVLVLAIILIDIPVLYVVVAAALFVLVGVLLKLIFVTLGLGIILVNALTLYILDIFSNEITIIGISALVYATLIVSAVNILINFSAKRVYKQ